MAEDSNGKGIHREILLEIRNVSENGNTYDLFLTNYGIVAIWISERSFGVVFGLSGILVDRVVKNWYTKKKRANVRGLTLDLMLASDEKNYQIPYDSIRSFKVESKIVGRSIEIEYGGQKRRYSMSWEAIKELFEQLPKITQLQGKLDFSVEGGYHRAL